MNDQRRELRRFAKLLLACIAGFATSAVALELAHHPSADPNVAAAPGPDLVPGSTASALQTRFVLPAPDGYVNTHEHPTVGMAFGGNYGWAGETASGPAVSNYVDGIPESVVPTHEVCTGCLEATCGDHAEQKGIFLGDAIGVDMGLHPPHAGVKNGAVSHLPYSTTWVRWAYEDGMKIMVAYAVESEALCNLIGPYNDSPWMGGPGANYACSVGDSKASLMRQIDAIKAWAARTAWIEVAYSASDARAITRRGNLAVIIGIEADYAFGSERFSFNARQRVQEYYDAGVRTAILAHKVNSRLAGADVFRPVETKVGKTFRALQGVSGCLHYDDSTNWRYGQYELISGNGNHDFCSNSCGDFHIQGRWPANGCNGSIEEIQETTLNTWINDGDTHFNGFAAYPTPPGFETAGASSGTYVDWRGIERNNLGLSIVGKRVINKMMDLGMILTIDHISSEARLNIRDHVAQSEHAYYPLNAFHNAPNSQLVPDEDDPDITPYDEYNFTNAELNMVRDSGGFFGVRLGPMDSKGYGASGVSRDCPGTSTETAKILAWLLDREMSVGYSLDLGAGVKGIFSREERRCGEDLGTDWLAGSSVPWDHDGMGHFGKMAAFHRELEAIGLKEEYLSQLENDGVEQFIQMWSRSEGYRDVVLP
ncbi:MAG: membrane dipeptidase [Myxococcota bacterium]|nr:membrane dipeptidase [Myxococcota bacterium]